MMGAGDREYGDTLNALISVVEWEEPFILALIAFHLISTIVNFLTRKLPTIQAILFVSFLAPVFFSESLNKLAAEHSSLFTRHQYFDSRGMFISLMVSAPLLFNCLVMVMNWLFISSQLMTRYQLVRMKGYKRPSEEEKKED